MVSHCRPITTIWVQCQRLYPKVTLQSFVYYCRRCNPDILKYEQHTFLAKVDIKSAFRQIPVHPADRHLLGMRWHKQVYIDSCLPFGLRSAPKLFNILADLVSWIAAHQGISCILHYLDHFYFWAHHTHLSASRTWKPSSNCAPSLVSH